MLSSSFIGMFYTTTLHAGRSSDHIKVVYSRTLERAQQFAREWDIPKATAGIAEQSTIRRPIPSLSAATPPPPGWRSPPTTLTSAANTLWLMPSPQPDRFTNPAAC